MLAYRVRDHTIKTPHELRKKKLDEKKINLRWGRVQTTQAGKTRKIKYVHAESSRWLRNKRRDTKKMNIPGYRKK